MKGNIYAHPCGFCGAVLQTSPQCPGCGVWWSERNFSFLFGLSSLNKGSPELYAMQNKFPVGYERYWSGDTEWIGFDEDDAQAMEVYAAEYEGYILGERFLRRVPYEVGDDESVWKEVAQQVVLVDAAVAAPVPEASVSQTDFGMPL